MIDAAEGTVGPVNVIITNNRAMTVDELADLAMDKILGVSIHAPTAIKEQALTYRALIRAVVVEYMNRAVEHDRINRT
jgi:hypothetical protein